MKAKLFLWPTSGDVLQGNLKSCQDFEQEQHIAEVPSNQPLVGGLIKAICKTLSVGEGLPGLAAGTSKRPLLGSMSGGVSVLLRFIQIHHDSPKMALSSPPKTS